MCPVWLPGWQERIGDGDGDGEVGVTAASEQCFVHVGIVCPLNGALKTSRKTQARSKTAIRRGARARRLFD
jgi:hypothetical protein